MAITLNKLISILSVFMFSLTIVSLGEQLHWSIELFAHFREFLLLVSLCGLILALFQSVRLKAPLILFLSAIATHGLILISFWLNTAESFNKKMTDASEHNILVANINSANNQKDKLINYLNTSKDDTVILLEVTKNWGESLRSIEGYPFSKIIALESNFGIAVFSRHPIGVTDVLTDRTNWIPHLILTIEASDGPLNLVVTHAFPPIGSYGHLIHERHLETLARRINSLAGPTLVCGDFNSAPWTRRFQNFLNEAELKFQGDILSVIRSWPNLIFFPRIPIDYCLKRDVHFVSTKTGPEIGSDHKTIQYRFQY